MPMCLACHQSFPDYKELALHIQSSRKGHRKGKKWAAKFLLHATLMERKELNGHIALTEEQKETKRNLVREISGDIESVVAICPQCHKGHREILPVEFTQSNQAWRSKDCLVVMCGDCR